MESINPATLIFNGVLGVAVLIAIVVVARVRTARVAVWSGLLGGIAIVVLAALLGEGGFGRMRLLAYGVFLHGTIYLLAVGLLGRARFKAVALSSLVLGLINAGIAIDAFFIEPHWLEVTHYQVQSEKVTTPLRIAVIADLQTDSVGEYERRVLEAALAERPDLVLLPGDYLQTHDEAAYARLVIELHALFAELQFSARLGVYAVEGNVDHPGWTAIFADLPMTCFERTESVDVAGVRVTGLSLSNSRSLNHTITSDDTFHIVFGHYPDFVLGDIQADLMVAGHTHGGQVQFPGFGPPITLSRVPRHWAAGGMFEVPDKGTLIVSRGIGMERDAAPRLRFLCRPQLVLVDIIPK